MYADVLIEHSIWNLPQFQILGPDLTLSPKEVNYERQLETIVSTKKLPLTVQAAS